MVNVVSKMCSKTFFLRSFDIWYKALHQQPIGLLHWLILRKGTRKKVVPRYFIFCVCAINFIKEEQNQKMMANS